MMWKLGKLRYSFEETVTSAGVKTLLADSPMWQVFTGATTHDLVLPDATTTSNGSGIAFFVVNESAGAITVRYDDNTVLKVVPAGASVDLVLTSHSTSNGTWRVGNFTGGGGGGLGSVAPGSVVTTTYPMVPDDSGRVIWVDSSAGAFTVTLPAPSLGFVVTVKDVGNVLSIFPVTVVRNGSELIDGLAENVVMATDRMGLTFISDGTDWFRVGGFVPRQSAFGRGLFVSGLSSNVIDYVDLYSTASAIDFGDLTSSRSGNASTASSTRGVHAGGSAPSAVIDYTTFATLGNGAVFGNLTVARGFLGGCGSRTRGLFGGGSTGSDSNVIDYVTVASLSDAQDFGDLTSARQGVMTANSRTRGIFAGGQAAVLAIDYVTIASLGNGANFGDLTQGRGIGASGACGSALRGIFVAGNNGGNVNTIDYVTIATLGNAIDFGDLSSVRNSLGGCSSPLRSFLAGGNSGPVNTLEYITNATLGNGTTFGTLTAARSGLSGCSNIHGGI